MGAIKDAGRAAFRDFVTDGVPASGANEPAKSEIRALFDLIDSAVSSFGDVLTGTNVYNSNTTLNDPVALGDVLIKPASGVTVTIKGRPVFPKRKIFDLSLGGTVVIDPTADVWALPEWWGAVDGGADCYDSITACLASALHVQFGGGDYYFSDTIKLIRPHQRIRGMGSEWTSDYRGATRLLIEGGTLPAIQVGPDAEPSDINHFEVQVDLRDFYVARTVAPVIASGCAAIKFQYTLACYVQNVKTNEAMRGFEFDGNVYMKLVDCTAVRESPGSGSGTDNWKGFYANGSSDIGAAGGNASIYLNFCRAACNNATLSTGDSNGFYCDFNYTDIFIESFETVSCAVGMNIQGNSSGAIMTNVDLQIKNATNDAFTKYGIFINNVNTSGCAEVTAGYVGPAPAALHAVLIQNSYGVVVRGGQFVMLASGSCTALGAINCHGLVIDRPLILEAVAGAVVISGSSSFDARPVVKNYDRVLSAPAVLITGGSTRGYAQPVATGASGKIAQGVRVDTSADSFNEVNCSLIDPACLPGGASGKLLFGATPVTAAGSFNTNCLASGIMS